MSYQIFLSSCFDQEMQKNREVFRADLIARFNERSGRYGENTFITDFEYGIPDGLKAEKIIDICVANVKNADLFMCILGKRYGYIIEKNRLPEEFLEFRDLLMPKSAEDDYVSFFEIEILAALLFIPEKTSFLVWNTSVREDRADRLLAALVAHSYDISFFESRKELSELAVNRFVYYSGYMYISETETLKNTSSNITNRSDAENMSPNLTESQIIYLSRKLRYNIPQETIISKISAYVDSSSSDTFVLVGNSDSGKSMVLAEWVRRNMNRADISIHAWFHEEGAGFLSIILMHLLADEQNVQDFFYQDDVVHTFYNMAVTKKDRKQVFIIDGIDHLEEARDVGWLITSMDPTVKIIITLNNRLCAYLPKAHVNVEYIPPLSVSRLIQRIYELEGKGLEYPYIQNLLEDVCKNWSLRQTAEGIQQFLRIMKYQPGSSKKNWDSSKFKVYLGKFDSMYGIFGNTKLYLESNFDPIIVHQSISLLALTERGLSRKELSDLIQGKIEIFYQLYFVLVQNEDLFMLPKAVIKKQLNSIPRQEMLKYRKKLIGYFKNDASDRAVIEICWQLAMIPNKEELVAFLSDIGKWRLIHTNSSLYFAGIDRILSKEQWNQIVTNWKKQLEADPNRYSETDIYAISDGLNELCRIEDAANVIKILIQRGENTFLMASYHQQIASLYEDLGDDRAIGHIEEAVRLLETVDDMAFLHNIIDTYSAGAYIYAFFLNKKDYSEDQKKQNLERLENWLQKVIQLAEQARYENPDYLVQCYHNAAYVYWNIQYYSNAIEYINQALSIPRPDESLIVSDLELRAQIYNDFYCFQNEYLSEETGVLMIGADPEHKYLKLAEKDLKKAIKMQKQLTDKVGNAYYMEELAHLHYNLSQNYGYRGKYKEAVKEIDITLDLEIKAGVSHDLYATYYQAAIARFGAYNKWRDKKFLVETLEYLNCTEEEIYQNGTTDAYYYLEDVLKLKQFILEKL